MTTNENTPIKLIKLGARPLPLLPVKKNWGTDCTPSGLRKTETTANPRATWQLRQMPGHTLA
eukprot:2685797-Lingulodinium_polyedra.AAC.2